MEIKKLKIVGREVSIDLLRRNGQDDEAVSFSSTDDRDAAFTKAFEALEGDFRYVMEMQDNDKLTLQGIVVGAQGSVARYKYTGLLTVGAGSTSVNSPHVYEPAEEATGEAFLTEKQHARILKALELAEAYYLGERQQTEMFEPSEEEAAAAVH